MDLVFLLPLARLSRDDRGGGLKRSPQHSTLSVQSPRGSNPLLLLFFAMHEAHIGAHRDPFLHIIKIMLFQIDT